MVTKSSTKETAYNVKRDQAYDLSGEVVLLVKMLTNVVSIKNDQTTFEVEKVVSLQNGINPEESISYISQTEQKWSVADWCVFH